MASAAGADPQGHSGQGGRDGSPPRGGSYERADAPRGHAPESRRPPGGGYYAAPSYQPPPYQSPRYPAPPPRRPFGAEPGWRPAPVAPPGAYGGRMASLGWVVESIDRRSPGRVLDARVEDLGGRPVYRVIWLTVHGRRMEYTVDAATGAVLDGR